MTTNKYKYQVICGSSFFNCITFDDALDLMYEKSKEKEDQASVVDRKGKTICTCGITK